MIFYFSATGNSRHAAKRIADATDDRIISITECLKKGLFDFTAKDGETVGFALPVYNFGLPVTVVDFIKKCGVSFYLWREGVEKNGISCDIGVWFTKKKRVIRTDRCFF